jgi:DNA-binding GntR family transcriptional regulator
LLTPAVPHSDTRVNQVETALNATLSLKRHRESQLPGIAALSPWRREMYGPWTPMAGMQPKVSDAPQWGKMKTIQSAKSRAEQAYLVIRESIVDGTLAPGAHLVQEDLAAQLGVSRQPVQQAMSLLKNDGLVVEIGARGLHVAPLDLVDTERRCQIRAVLEQLAVREATLRAAARPAFADELRREGEALLEAGERMVEIGAHREAVAHDVAFHSFLSRASGNPLLESTAQIHWLYFRRVMIAAVRFADRGPIVWCQHREILDAVCSGRLDEAVSRMATHIYGSRGALTTALARMKVGEIGHAEAATLRD